MNLEQARNNMVEQQIRTWEVLDQDVLDLLYLVPREEFVPPEHRSLAFSDLEIPIGHGEGNYFAPPDMLQQLEANRQVVLRYTDPNGRLDDAWNPNGSVNAIAAICNERRNVVGMMPHPERACEPLLGGVDGRMIFESIVGAMAVR